MTQQLEISACEHDFPSLADCKARDNDGLCIYKDGVCKVKAGQGCNYLAETNRQLAIAYSLANDSVQLRVIVDSKRI